MTPEIAVIVPTYRGSDGVLRVIDALEQQTLAADRFEVVIVDDHSGDGAVDLIAGRLGSSSLCARVIDTGVNGGPAAARNLGARSASAPLLAFMDDDCIPSPGWLEAGMVALDVSERIGVVQGATVRPPGAVLGDWTVFREVLGPTPFFEGCNIFYRREALLSTPGFDEAIRWYWEDTAAGWAVVDAGWDRGFAPDAVIEHEVEDRGMWWLVSNGLLERNAVTIAARHPGFRQEAFWRPWAFRRENAAITVALVGVVGALRWRPAILLALPWLWWRRPPRGHHRYAALYAERVVVDTAQAVGLAAGSLKNRILVL